MSDRCKAWSIQKDGPMQFMGILNCTPDSFSDGGMNSNPEAAVQNALTMIKEGADIIDVGGESTRPGSMSVGADEQIARVLPVIKLLRRSTDIPISIDTQLAEVADAALLAGADIINDISALRTDPDMASLAKEHGVSVILMHMQGTPTDMQDAPQYEDIIREIISFFEERIEFACSNGIERDSLILDPGIGFGKSVEHNLKIIAQLGKFNTLGLPLLFGASRKSVIGAVLNQENPLERLEGCIALSTLAVLADVRILRVHDVGPNLRAVRMAEAVCDAV